MGCGHEKAAPVACSTPCTSATAISKAAAYACLTMERPMNKEDEVIRYHEQFLDLAKPLLDSHWLDNEECDMLFWYRFHPEDCTMILSWSYPHQTRTYLHLKLVFYTMHAIFSQPPYDLQMELQHALEGYSEFRRPHLN